MSDLISRQDAIEAVATVTMSIHLSNVLCDKLLALPSADRPTGEWVRKYDKQINCYWYECNQCGEYRPRNVIGKEWSSPYCPNCGKRMHKGGEDE